MVTTRQSAAKKVKSLLAKKKEPTAEELQKIEESNLEREELLHSESENEEIDEIETEESQKKSTVRRGVVFLSHIPNGFHEDEMRKYFSQFGKVFRVKLSRNPKTWKSQHFGHIEFESEKIAQIVAKTMNGYLLYENKLVCKLVPKKKHFAVFDSYDDQEAQRPRFFRRLAYQKRNGIKSSKAIQRRKKNAMAQLEHSKEQWKAKGIQYDISSLTEKQS